MQTTQKERTKLQGKLNSQRAKPTVIKILSPLEAERKARQLERKKFNAVINELRRLLHEEKEMIKVWKNSVNMLYSQVCALRREQETNQQRQDRYQSFNEKVESHLRDSVSLDTRFFPFTNQQKTVKVNQPLSATPNKEMGFTYYTNN